MLIVTLDAMCRPILEWFQDEQIELRKRILVDEVAGEIGVVGGYERLSL